MENKINISELLKDCPSGMELDCTMYEDIYFDYVDGLNIIHCHIQYETHKTSITFNQHGTPNSDIKSKCVIFPKGKTTWEGFVPPCKYKNGDVVFYNDTIAIFKEWGDATLFRTHACTYLCAEILDVNIPLFGNSIKREMSYATEEEKEKLFKVIKDNGYKWNVETKTLEKLIEPKFKVGDRIKKGDKVAKIVRICKNCYDVKYDNGIGTFTIDMQDNWELAPNKFDITTLKSFESRVLVRDSAVGRWLPVFFGCICDNKDCPYLVIGGNKWKYCIPFEGNEHLLDKTDDCDEYYKTWED